MSIRLFAVTTNLMQRGKKKITRRYLILDGDSMSGLANSVDNALAQGAQCVGGVFVLQSTWENETRYYQAIIF